MATQMIFPLAILLLSYVVTGFVLIEMTVWVMSKRDHSILPHRSVMPPPEAWEGLFPVTWNDARRVDFGLKTTNHGLVVCTPADTDYAVHGRLLTPSDIPRKLWGLKMGATKWEVEDVFAARGQGDELAANQG